MNLYLTVLRFKVFGKLSSHKPFNRIISFAKEYAQGYYSWAYFNNIENNKTVARLNEEDYRETNPDLFHSIRIHDAISDLVTDNIDQFSTAQLKLKINEQTGKLYIVAVER